MINTSYVIAAIAVSMACTVLERALPFLVFRGREVPKPVRYLGDVLPMAIMATLVIYCLKSINFSETVNFAPQLVATAVTVVLHLWRNNTLISILGGTVTCMILMHLM